MDPGRNLNLDRLTAVRSLVVENTHDAAVQDGTKGREGWHARSEQDNRLRSHASQGDAVGLYFQAQEEVREVDATPDSCSALPRMVLAPRKTCYRFETAEEVVVY